MRRACALFLSALLAACGGAVEEADPVDGDEIDVGAAEAWEAAAAKADAAGLTTTEARTLLRLLDDDCADTWCSGDYDWQFRRAVCNFGERACTITMFVEEHGGAATWWRACRITNVSRYTSVVRDGRLTSGFYGAMDRCIARIEAKL
jgi:hypothetical protein